MTCPREASGARARNFGDRGTDTHWQANGESYWLIGDAMAHEMLTLIKSK